MYADALPRCKVTTLHQSRSRSWHAAIPATCGSFSSSSDTFSFFARLSTCLPGPQAAARGVRSSARRAWG